VNKIILDSRSTEFYRKIKCLKFEQVFALHLLNHVSFFCTTTSYVFFFFFRSLINSSIINFKIIKDLPIINFKIFLKLIKIYISYSGKS